MRNPDRRQLLVAALAGLMTSGAWAKSARPTQVALLGQSLLTEDVANHRWPGRAALAARIGRADVAFTDLEVAIRGPREGPPTRNLDTLHIADPVVIDVLKALGIDLFATSNNHAFDIGTGGILDAIAALRARDLAFAGTGENLAAASAPAVRGPVALVAGAAGMVRAGGAATPDRAGVHELRGKAGVGLDAGDAARMFASIAEAKKRAPVVIAYLHNHLWEPDNSRTSEWQRAFARACVDAGASVFAAHGAPLLHGVETYRGAPLFHCLGNLFFQTRKAEGHYDFKAWQSIIAECRFDGGNFLGADLIPVQLSDRVGRSPTEAALRGMPALATGASARAVLDQLARQSALLGFTLAHDGRIARLPAA